MSFIIPAARVKGTKMKTTLLFRVAARLHEAVQDEDYDALAAPGLVDQLCEALRDVDLYLTGKDDNRRHDRKDAEALLGGEPWLVYLSDGGYSRLVIQIVDPDQPPVWIDRGLSTASVIARWDANQQPRERVNER